MATCGRVKKTINNPRAQVLSRRTTHTAVAPPGVALPMSCDVPITTMRKSECFRFRRTCDWGSKGEKKAWVWGCIHGRKPPLLLGPPQQQRCLMLGTKEKSCSKPLLLIVSPPGVPGLLSHYRPLVTHTTTKTIELSEVECDWR